MDPGVVAYSREPRRVELREQMRRPLAAIAKSKMIGEIVDEDPDRWSQSSAGREYKIRVTSSEHQPGSIRTKRPSLIGRSATSVGKREIPVPAQAASTRMLNSLVHRIGSNATTAAASSGPVRVQLGRAVSS